MDSSNALKSISTGCIINGSDAKQYSDDQIINMLVAERKKLETLAEKVGAKSKYYVSKAKGIEEDIALLATELESRAQYVLVLIKQGADARKEWVVWDTDAKKRVYGPNTRDNCERKRAQIVKTLIVNLTGPKSRRGMPNV